MTEPRTHMTNAQGHLVPVETISATDLLKDELVKTFVEKAIALNALLADFKRWGMDEVTEFRELVADNYGVKLGGAKGNIELASFDGTLIVQVQIGESISFGPELTAAKALIDECVREWSADSNANVRALVEHAFQVNKKGRIDTGRVLGLRTLDIDDDRWKRAMDAISDSVQVTGRKPYLRIYRQDPTTEDRAPISLNIAAI